MCGNAALCAKMRERVPKSVNVFCENTGRVRKTRERMRAGGPLHMERAKGSFLWGAAVVSVGGLLAKVLGAFYRVPLMNALGGEGAGVYQMVYPLYCLLLTFSSAGVPAALSRLVAQAEAAGDALRSRQLLRRSLALFSLLGLLGSAAMFFAARPMSALQGAPAAVWAYRALAPSVLFVSVIACFRGWFQGRGRFFPTALSEVAEQLVKIVPGLYFSHLFRGDMPQAVAFSLLAVTVSEAAAALLLFALAAGERRVRAPLFRPAPPKAAYLLRVTLPVAVAAGVLPLSNMLDSVLIVRIVGGYAENATALYGLYAGGAQALAGLPASVCYGLAAASVPAVAALRAAGKAQEAERKVLFSLKCTLFIALPAAAFFLAFPRGVCALLYPAVTGAERETLVGLLRVSAVGGALLAGAQTLSACLTGLGRPRVAALAFTAAAGAKLLLEAGLLQLPQLSVFGAAYAAGASYFIALFLNLVYSIKERGNRLRLLGHAGKFAAMAAIAAAAALPLRGVHVLACLAAGGAAYLLAAFAFRAFSAEEIPLLRRKGYGHHRRIGYKRGRSVGRRRLRAPFGRARRAAHGRDRARRGRARVGRAL